MNMCPHNYRCSAAPAQIFILYRPVYTLTNVLSICFFTWTFASGLLIHIHQTEKIALYIEIAAKVASVKGRALNVIL